jgi:hypothetical protein
MKRKFNGEVFTWVKVYWDKALAKACAESLRGQGYKARVITNNGGDSYQVFVRKTPDAKAAPKVPYEILRSDPNWDKYPRIDAGLVPGRWVVWKPVALK